MNPQQRLCLVVLLGCLFIVGCPTSPPQPGDDDDAADDDVADLCESTDASVTDLTPDQLAAMLEDKDFELVNVHVPYAGEIPDTDAHISYLDIDALEAQMDHQLDARVVLYCRTGPMSATATAAMVNRGYCQVFDLKGGMAAWENDGYELDP